MRRATPPVRGGPGLSLSYVDALTSRAEISSWFVYREAVDPTFQHVAGARFGHDCMSEGCGT